MISILSEGFWGKKLYAAIAAMRFAANPPMLLWRVRTFKFEVQQIIRFFIGSNP